MSLILSRSLSIPSSTCSPWLQWNSASSRLNAHVRTARFLVAVHGPPAGQSQSGAAFRLRAEENARLPVLFLSAYGAATLQLICIGAIRVILILSASRTFNCTESINLNQMEKGKVKAPKAVWDAYATKIFCQICKEETLAGNRPGTTLSSIGYKNLEEKIFAITKRRYPHGKLKNKWDALKPQYNLWLDLKRATTGLGFDVVKGTITASAEWWEEKIAENNKYSAFRGAPMENLDELEVMFQHINVIGLSSVIPGVQKTATPIEVGDDSNENEEDRHISKDAKREGKRKASDVALPFSPKKGRNPMVKQVSRLIDVLSTSKSKNEQKVEDDIIELMDQAVNAGASEGSDEHFMATQLFVKRENRAVFRSIKTNDGKVAWLKRMYEERKKK